MNQADETSHVREVAENEVRASNFGLSQLGEANVIGTAVVRLDGTILSINDYYLDILGCSRAEFEAQGLNLKQLAPMTYDTKWIPEELRNRGRVEAFECPRLRRDGSIIWTMTAYAMSPDQPDVAYAWAVDITEKKRSDMTSQFLLEANKIMASSMELEPLMDKIVSIALMNDFCDFCTIHIPEKDGRLTCRALVHRDPARLQQIKDIIRRFPRFLGDVGGPARTIRTGKSEMGVKSVDGTLEGFGVNAEHNSALRREIVKSYLCVPLGVEGRIIGAMTMTSDHRNFTVDDLKVAEALALRAGQHIENAKLHTEVQQTSLDLKRSNQDLSHFASVAAHDLKSPLATAQGFLEILLEDTKSIVSDDQISYLYRAILNLEKMRRQVDQLLTFSRVRSGKLDRREISLEGVVRSAMENLAAEIEGSQAVIDFEGLPKINGDQTLLTVLFQNLLSNCIRYRREERLKVVIRAERSLGALKICVKDNGRGFDSKQAGRIFKLFEQLPESSTPSSGQGIGLATCLKIVESHGGKIWAESVPGEGSKFCFTLPFELPTA